MTNPKVLIIRFRQLGDAVLSSSLCTSIKRSMPGAEIHYVLNEHIASAFQNHPDIDKIIVFRDEDNKSLLRYTLKIWSLVRREKYSIIIDTRTTIRTLLFSIFSRSSKYRIGRRKSYNKIIHNYRIDNLPNGSEDMLVLTLKLLEPLKKEFLIKSDYGFYLHVSEQEKKRFKSKMEADGVDFSKPLILCNVTTKLAFKCWDMKKMQAVLQRILDKYLDVQLIFNFGGKAEKQAALDLYESMNRNERIFINIVASNTADLVAMVANCNFYFGNEGGTRHISQALNMPSFAIYAPSAKKNVWLPSSSNSSKFQGIEAEDVSPQFIKENQLTHDEKFALIDVDSVWSRLDLMLGKYLNKS